MREKKSRIANFPKIKKKGNLSDIVELICLHYIYFYQSVIFMKERTVLFTFQGPIQ